MKTDRHASGVKATPSEFVSNHSESRRLGLCMTCRHADYCTFPHHDDCPVLQCEEFEVETKEAESANLHIVPDATKTRHSDAGNEERPLGLCANCAHRDTCTFPKSEGGVWHCEEYE